MWYTDTRDSSLRIDFRQAVIQGMSEKTGGLYIPTEFPKLPDSFLNRPSVPTFRETAFEMAKPYTEGTIPPSVLEEIIVDAYPFDVPVKPLDPNTYVLELFHGPTCAFKDVGARFMARVMGYFNKDEDKALRILVATSGDTGSAVGSAFHNIPGIDVTILYPKGRISHIQEKQLSTFTGNIRALSVNGSFDDCQRLVKEAFTDSDLRGRFKLSSANSINISRLLPQAFYYMRSSLLVKNRMNYDPRHSEDLIIVTVPSGNFGNLTSGCIAKKMGAPIDGFIAATNTNCTIPLWLESGKYQPKESVATLSNAMDVGSPSNQERLASIYSLEEIKNLMAGFWVNDAETLESIENCSYKTGYTLDPHGAVSWRAWDEIRKGAMKNLLNGIKRQEGQTGLVNSVPAWGKKAGDGKCTGIILETAHPAKFGETVEKALGHDPVIPERLEKVLHLPDKSIPMEKDFRSFKEWLMENL